jgi:hypothetical protein
VENKEEQIFLKSQYIYRGHVKLNVKIKNILLTLTSSSANQANTPISCNPKFHLASLQEPEKLNSFPSQRNLIQTSHPSSLSSVLVLSSYVGLDILSGLFPLMFPIKIVHTFIFSRMYATHPRPSRHHRTDHPKQIWRGVKIIDSQCSFPQHAITYFITGENIFLSNLLSKTIGLYSSFNTRE